MPAAVLAVAAALGAAVSVRRLLLAGTSMIAELVGVPLQAMRSPGIMPGLTLLVGAVVGVNLYLLLRCRAPRTFVRFEVVAYLVLAAYLVLFKSPGVRGLNLDLTDAAQHMTGELVFNVALLVPFGALTYRWWGRLGVALGVAGVVVLGVEALQYVFALGVSDVVDVVTNLAGVVIGYCVVAVAARCRWTVREDKRHYVILRQTKAQVAEGGGRPRD